LEQGINFSKAILFSREGDENATSELFEFLSGRGPHSLTPRVLSSRVVAVYWKRLWYYNAVVDSEPSVSFLLSLPIKLAFKTYEAFLPAAVKTRNFDRLLRLANVGNVSWGGRFGKVAALVSR